MRVKFKKINPQATIPTRGTPLAAGMDLYAGHTCVVPARGRALVKTGLTIELPPGYEGQVRPRSGLALKHGVTVLNSPGTIDEDYRGELGVVLFNTTDQDFEIAVGDRVGQLVIAPVSYAIAEEVTDLSTSDRGDKGFGSTGR